MVYGVGAPARAGHPSALRGALVGGAVVVVLATIASGAVASAAANNPPQFPRVFKFVTKTSYQYDGGGLLFGGVTKITVKTPPKDPDRDRLTYAWTAVSKFRAGYKRANKIRGRGLTAAWTRDLDSGQLAAGIVTLTVRDGRGGKAVHTFTFERGEG